MVAPEPAWPILTAFIERADRFDHGTPPIAGVAIPQHRSRCLEKRRLTPCFINRFC
jgi:hypothetical protein